MSVELVDAKSGVVPGTDSIEFEDKNETQSQKGKSKVFVNYPATIAIHFFSKIWLFNDDHLIRVIFTNPTTFKHNHSIKIVISFYRSYP
jgi:hypothetical protein